MKPFYTIFGVRLASYGSLIALGIIVASLVYWYRKKDYPGDKETIFYSIVYGMIGGFIGAKLLYLITDFNFVVDSFKNSPDTLTTLKNILAGGYVFYGGIIGALIAIYFYAKKYNMNYLDIVDSLAPEVPLAHAFGRIGCFMAGCCYGMPCDGKFCVIFPKESVGLSGIKLFPVQLLSALGNIIIFIILFIYSKKDREKGKVTGLYIILYGIARFLVEFLRYDDVRGHFLLFSTSQWISILLVPFGILLYKKGEYLCKKKQK